MNSPAPETTTMTNNNLAAQLKQIGLCTVPAQLNDFIARATKSRWSVHQVLEELANVEATERSRRSLERRLRICGIKSFKPMADFDWSWPTKIERDVIERLQAGLRTISDDDVMACRLNPRADGRANQQIVVHHENAPHLRPDAV